MIIEAGVVSGLLTIKEVRKAIGRLVSGIVDVPHAYLESWSQAVRSETGARKAISSAIADAAREAAKKDSALVDRGLERWTHQLGARQQTREAVALATLDVLAEGELPHGAAAPSEDFMRMFEDLVEKVSSEELVDLMARILAGEIRKPGSVSRRTLAVVPVIDQEIVSILAKIRPHLLADAWVHVPPSLANEWTQDFALLSSVSLSSEIGPRILTQQNGQSFVRMGSMAIVLTANRSNVGWFVDGAHLTNTGIELVSLLPFDEKYNVDDVARGFKELDFVTKVVVGTLVDVDGGVTLADAREIV